MAKKNLHPSLHVTANMTKETEEEAGYSMKVLLE